MSKNYDIYIDDKILVYSTEKIDLFARSMVKLCEGMGATVSVIETIRTPKGVRAAEVYNTKQDHLNVNGEIKNKITTLFNSDNRNY